VDAADALAQVVGHIDAHHHRLHAGPVAAAKEGTVTIRVVDDLVVHGGTRGRTVDGPEGSDVEVDGGEPRCRSRACLRPRWFGGRHVGLEREQDRG
jgi:hypothetical protein